jgi:hypothetical protein
MTDEFNQWESAPCDWDGESWCAVDGCDQPGTHALLTGMADGMPVYEVVCCRHAVQEPTS